MSQPGIKRGLLVSALVLIFAVMSTSCNDNLPELSDGLYADFETTRGNIIVELFPEDAPLTVMNFVGLAEGDLPFASKQGAYYDGLTFHRVIADFMIQGGDPEGTGRGGPGYRFADETYNGLVFDKPGILAMANAGPDTNGSQFFITHLPTPHLDGKHTIFGEVVEGQDVVDSIRQGDKIKTLTILRIGNEAKGYEASEAEFRALEAGIAEMEAEARAKRQQEQMEKMKAFVDGLEDEYADEIEEIRERWPDAVMDEYTGVFSVIRQEGSGDSPAPGSSITCHYVGTVLEDGHKFDSSRDRGEPISFPVGVGRLIPGWDLTLVKMKKGERRIMIIPPELAYGSNGVPQAGIPGDAWLVFDVELIDF